MTKVNIKFTEHESYWRDKNVNISDCIYNSRINCPYEDGLFKTMYMYNANYNIPCLLIYASYIQSIANKYKKIVFCTRDCCYLYLIYTKLFSNHNVGFFLSSRSSYMDPTLDYHEYVANIIIPNTLIVDMCGTGLSFSSYFNSINRKDVDIMFLSDLIDGNDMLEFVNYVRFGSLINFRDQTPVFATLEYPQYLSYTIEKNILNVLDFIKPGQSYAGRLNDLKKYQIILHDKQMMKLKKKYHVSTHVKTPDPDGVAIYKDFFKKIFTDYGFPSYSYEGKPSYSYEKFESRINGCDVLHPFYLIIILSLIIGVVILFLYIYK
jgi:hypothetical protein